MAGSPRVQLSLKGRLLSEVAFVGPQLRIGRMRENDVVVNNLAVSRFHATLRREGEGFVLEDLGSENGTQINGERITGSVALKPSDVIQLGKYELRIVTQAGPQIAGPPKAKASDAWDSSQTFLALQARPTVSPKPAPSAAAPQAAPSPAAASAGAAGPEIFEEAELVAEAPGEDSAPDPRGVFAFGEDDLAGADPGAAAAAAEPEFETDPLTPPNPEHTSLFDFGAPATLAPLVPETSAPAPASALPAYAPAAPASRLHAGLIVQRDGKLHLLRPWDDGELVAGRAPECEIVLADAGVSRRHAAFSCGPDGYAVRDLESVNGIYVNGQRTKHHTLAVGDVVRIESFELTFVLDHQPIGSEVSGPKAVAAREHERSRATQFSLEASTHDGDDALELTSLAGDPNEAPAAPSTSPFEEITDGFEILPPADDPRAAEAATAEPVLDLSLPESDLVGAEEMDADDEKEAAVPATLVAPAVPSASASAPLAVEGVALRLVVDTSRLSRRAREALAVLAEEGAALSAQLRVERGEA